MITAVVTFKLPPGLTREQWQEHNKQVSARFQNVPGLIRKQFLYNEKGIGGGVYLWETLRQPRHVTTKALGVKTCVRLLAGMNPISRGLKQALWWITKATELAPPLECLIGCQINFVRSKIWSEQV